MRKEIDDYLQWMALTNYAPRTITLRRKTLGYFLAWCEDRSLDSPATITKKILESYQRHLFHHRTTKGEPLTFHVQHNRLVQIRSFFTWLCKQDRLPANPAADLDLPKLTQRLPKTLLSVPEVESILALPDLSSPAGIRDKALLEILYSTGIRRNEAANLTLYDLQQDRQIIVIRQGKGRKDRYLPLGQRALHWLNQYLEKGRPKLLHLTQETTLFLNSTGQPFHPNGLGNLVRKYIQRAQPEKEGSCHLFRHACATHLLDNGADLRSIQQLLGHQKLETTELYTHLSIERLKEVHANNHPAETAHNQRQKPDSKSDPT